MRGNYTRTGEPPWPLGRGPTPITTVSKTAAQDRDRAGGRPRFATRKYFGAGAPTEKAGLRSLVRGSLGRLT